MDISDRIQWALAKITTLVAVGRNDGWLPGLPIDPPTIPIPSTTGPMGRLLRLGLSRTQVDVLWILSCVELDPGLARAAQALVTPGMQELNPQIVEGLVAHEGRLMPAELDQLVRLGLVELSPGVNLPLYRRALRASDRVLDLARGIWSLDREIEAASLIVPRQAPARDDLMSAAARGDSLIVVSGLAGSGRTSAVFAACSNHPVLVLDANSLPKDSVSASRQLRILARETRLHQARLVVRNLDVLDAQLVSRELLDGITGPVFATTRMPCTWSFDRHVVNVVLSIPNCDERAALWMRAIPSIDGTTAITIGARYSVTPGMIRDVGKTVLAQNLPVVEPTEIRVALRHHLEKGLVDIAKRVETKQTWDDLVLPDDQLDLIEELVGRVRCRGKVLDTWGFRDKVGRGLGIAALFSGPPGTGKTMIAGLIAKELELDLYQIDLSKIVSKYIGETEKQLGAVFDAAESGHAILLFDEADSLFGKRSEVRSSNDRYANLEVNYLLQRIEAFSGISLLTSNHESSIDPAFQRRLSIHMRIPLPDEDQRARMWQAMLPERAERTADIDFDDLATDYAMSGGYIKNAVLRAAYIAAASAKPICHAHLRRAARIEYEAMGKLTMAD